MNLQSILTFSSTILLSQVLNAAILSSEISGTVKSFDEKNVVLQQSGETINIPRKYFKATKLKSGEQVQLKLTRSELESLFKEQAKAK